MACVSCERALLDYLLVNARKSGARLLDAYVKLAEKGHLVVYYWCVKGSNGELLCNNVANIPEQALPPLLMVLSDCLALAPRLAKSHVHERENFVAAATRCSQLMVVTIKRNPSIVSVGDVVEETMIYSLISREDIPGMQKPSTTIHT